MVLEFSKFEQTCMHQNQNSHKPCSQHINYFNVQHLNGFQALTLPMSQSLCKSHLLLDLQILQATPPPKKTTTGYVKGQNKFLPPKVVKSSSFIITPPPWKFELCTAAHYQSLINYFLFFFICFHMIFNNVFISYVNAKFNLN